MITFIKKIEMCEAYHVHTAVDIQGALAHIKEYAPWRALPTIDFCEMRCSDEMQGQRMYTTKVTAKMRERISLPDAPVVFRLTDIYDETYLVGVPELCPPFPLVRQQDRAAAQPTDNSLCQLEISLKSPYPILKITD